MLVRPGLEHLASWWFNNTNVGNQSSALNLQHKSNLSSLYFINHLGPIMFLCPSLDWCEKPFILIRKNRSYTWIIVLVEQIKIRNLTGKGWPLLNGFFSFSLSVCPSSVCPSITLLLLFLWYFIYKTIDYRVPGGDFKKWTVVISCGSVCLQGGAVVGECFPLTQKSSSSSGAGIDLILKVLICLLMMSHRGRTFFFVKDTRL